MQVQEAPVAATPYKPQVVRLGGVGSTIEFRVFLTQMDTVKPEMVLKKGRITDFTDPLKVVEIDDKGNEGKAVEVPLINLVRYLSPPVILG